MRPRTWVDAKGFKDGGRVLKKKHQTKRDEDCTIKVPTMAITQNLTINLDGNF